MGHTNSTANYNLPQFIGTDKPTWLGDVNGAMSAIDAAIANAASAATDAASVATNAATVAAGAVTTANAASTTATAASTAASAATTTANNAAETANNAQSTAVLAKGTADATDAKVGALTDLQTTDKTSVVTAINEINGEVNKGYVEVTADGVKTYETLLDELNALTDRNKLTHSSVLVKIAATSRAFYRLASYSNTTVNFSTSVAASDSLVLENLNFADSPYHGSFISAVINTTPAVTITNASNTVPTNGTILRVEY